MQVDNCGKDLTRVKDYFKRYRVCATHTKQSNVRQARPLSCLDRHELSLLTTFCMAARSFRQALDDVAVVFHVDPA